MTLPGDPLSLSASSHGLIGVPCHRTDCRCILEMFCSCLKLTDFRRAGYWQKRAPTVITSGRASYLSYFAFRVAKKKKKKQRKLLDRHLCLPFPSLSSLCSPGKLRSDVLANMKLRLQVSRVSSLPHAQRYWCGCTCVPCLVLILSFMSQSEVK